MVNYSQSIIYKICCRNLEIKELYIGSTTNFSRRKCEHKTDCNNKNKKSYNYRVYQFIRDNGGWSNFDMVQIEQYNATDKNSLHARERYWLEQLKPSLNCNIPSRTRKQWFVDNRDTRLAYTKQYNQQNKAARLEYRKQHYQKIKEMRTCVCDSEYDYGNISSRNQHFRSSKHTEYVKKIHEHLSEILN